MRLDLPLDSHMHTDFSTDADVPIDVYAAMARERGVGEIAVTDHLDFDPSLQNYALDDFSRRETAIRAAADRWNGQPEIRFGVEITYQRRFEDEIRSYLRANRYDYVIGSVHHLGDTPDTHRGAEQIARWCRGKSLREASTPYWAEVDAAVRSGLFDTLGHLDVVKRWMYPHLGPLDYESHADMYERALKALVEHGVALEVNSSGLRHRQHEAYPPPAAVKLFRTLGGERVIAGTDAHKADSFGFGLADAYHAIDAAGFRSLTFRRGGDRVRIQLASQLARTLETPAST